MPAAYTLPRDWTTGELVTAALLNTHLRDMMMYFYSKRHDFVLVQDQKTSGTASATITNGAWRTSELNTEVADTGSLATVASNQITLQAGTWLAWMTAGQTANNAGRLRLYNTTDAAVLVYGAAGGFASNVNGFGYFSIAAAKVIELQHWVSSNSAAGGTALTTGDVEVYASVMLVKVSD
jgi:hypothetical protein